MSHSRRHSDDAERDLAHLRRLRPDAPEDASAPPPAGSVASAAGAGGQPAPGSREATGPSHPATGPTGRVAGDPAAGAGSYGTARFSDVDPAAVPRATFGLAMPVASTEPPGAVVGPSGPRADLPIPPAMQYPAGAPLGPLPGQHRPDPARSGTEMSSATATAVLPPSRAESVTGEWVTCPECGESSAIDPAQRRAEDFCPRCDFPLFWARTAVVPLSGEETGASLRRLPGTVGRAATASVACPHCGEPNSPTAIICIRCSLPMVIEQPEPEPEPEPVYVPPPPEPEPEPGFPLWWVVGVCVALFLITILVAWIALAV